MSSAAITGCSRSACAPKLADEVVRRVAAINDMTVAPSRNIMITAAIVIIKGMLGIVFAAVAVASFYVVYPHRRLAKK